MFDKVVSALLAARTGGADQLFRINEKWLANEEIIEYNFIKEYVQQNDELPPFHVFNSKFQKQLPVLSGRFVYEVAELRERFLTQTLAREIPKAMRSFKTAKASSIVTDLQVVLSNVGAEETKKDTNYAEGAVARYDRYKQKINVSGVTHLSTGDPVHDKMFYGYQRPDLITMAGRAGLGKCLGKDTPILMFDFSIKKVQDVLVGDLLMGPNGKPRTVLSLARGREQMYTVHQVKGISYRVNESHILSLKVPKTKNFRKTIKGKRVYQSSESVYNVDNIPVKNYLLKNLKYLKEAKGYKPACMQFEEQPVLIDPYFLGLWLGDGHSRELNFTNIDPVILAYCSTVAENQGGFFRKVPSSDIVYSFTKVPNLNACFKSYNLFSYPRINLLGKKHIPVDYLKNNEQIRLQLLAGLLDTDGYLIDNTYEISQKRGALALDILKLARSLGFRATMRRKRVSATNGTAGNLSYAYRIFISGDTDRIPVKVPYKKASKRQQVKGCLHTGIRVEKDIVDDYYGFTIDGDHLFCLGDFTVTHNTWYVCLMAILLEKALPDDAGPILISSNEIDAEDLKDRMDCIRFKLGYSDFMAGSLNRVDSIRYRNSLEKLEQEKSRIIIIDDVYTIGELEGKERLYNPSKVFIDGAYLYEPDNKMSQWDKMRYITSNVKKLAKRRSTPHTQTTQMTKNSGQKQSKTSFDAQDEFAFGQSFVQDSDIAWRAYRTPQMIYNKEIGFTVAKGRRIKPGMSLLWHCDLDLMNHSFKMVKDDEDDDAIAIQDTKPAIF